jgi:hypothetical protein
VSGRGCPAVSVRVGILTERVEAAPGELAAAQVSLHNDGAADATVRIRVVGLDGAAADPGAQDVVVSVPGGSETTCLVPVPVPAGLGIGEHAAGLEVSSDRPGDRPSLAGFTVSVGSVERVELTAIPATVRGLRRARLRVDVGNYEPVPVEVELHGESPEARLRFRRPHVRVLPGQHAVVGGKVKGPRRWAGEATQHTLVITGQGRASATSTTAVFVQRPLFARKLRGGLAAVLVVALWLGAIGGFVWWWRDGGDAQTAGNADATQAFDTDGDGVPDLYRTADGQEITAIDTDGDGVPDLFVTEDGQQIRGTDTDGDGDPDTFVDAAGNPVGDPRGGAGGTAGDVAAGAGTGGAGGGSAADGTGDEASDGPQSSVVRGTVSAAGSLDGITISLTPIALAGASDAAEPQALTGSGPGRSLGAPPDTSSDTGSGSGADDAIVKLWPARLGTPGADAPVGRRQSEPLKPMVTPLTTSPQADGVWLFTDVALRQSYELVFAKPGFDTKSFVVTPPDDGSAVEMDVELEPAAGSLSGRVSGPGGPLGGVAITLTDGTLTFSTTSATVGDVGTWSVEHVSTPGVYTVTGVRRGYGTEVRQVTLEPGQQFTGADLSMQPGVGSIAGRVYGPDGQPLGGVTVTASNEDDRHVTSTLTEGDIGAYHLPKVEAPGTYTLAVELPGYLTETRLVSVGGAVGDVDFTLTRTTLQLTGMVTSSAGGAGIPNAGLTLSTGDLTFKIATAGAPNPGSFAVEDLPPGNYTVRVEHYQHDTSTQFVTLTAGVPPPPLEIVLTPNGGIAGIGNGSLVVEVIDPTADTAERREIKNATVRLVGLATGETVRELTQEAFDFELADIPVGTYTIHVTAPRYNPAPPRRVSIGLSQARVQVELQRLGQASGRVVDSLDGTVLTDYFVSLYRQPEDPGDAPVFTLASRTDGTWQTPPDSLIPGTYRLEISDTASPDGYLVRNDQLLDPDVVGPTPDSRFMRFVLPEDALDPVVVADIEADRYPVLSGRVYRPTLNPASTTAQTSLVPIDAASLNVTLDCADASGPYTPALLDVAGTVGADQWDSFTIDPLQVDAGNLTGDCEVSVTADGLTPGTATIAGVDANDGNTVSDARIHVALAPPAPKVGGSVFWRNGSQRVPLADVDVSAAVLTAFPARRSGAESAPPEPTHTNLAATSQLDGTWDLDGQVYGVSDYTFDAAGFDQAVVEITVDDSGARVTDAASAVVTELSTGRFDVELRGAATRSLAGTLTIYTTATPVNFSQFTLTATSPTGAPVVEAPCVGDAPSIQRDDTPGPTSLDFTICNAGPGTWRVTVNEPAHFDYYGTPPPVEGFVDPVLAPPSFPLALAQLADLRITLLDSEGDPLDLPDGVQPTISLAGPPTLTGPIVVSGTAGNVFTLRDVPVAATNPHTTDRNYALTLGVDGYDVPSAVATGATYDIATGTFPISVRAGQVVDLTLRLPEYGSLTGEVFGRVTYNTTDPGHLTALLGSAGTVVTATPVDPVTGDPLGDTEPVALTGNDFEVSGPPGYYRIVATHPNYFDQTDADVPDDSVSGASTVVGVFLLANDVIGRDLGDWTLRARTGEIDLTVLDQLTGGTPVEGASYFLFHGGTAVPASVTTDDALLAGHTVIDGLLPGTYRLEVRRYATPGDTSTDQVAFPAITTVVIGSSTAATTSSVVVRAPLPPLAPTVTGAIVAENQLGDPVVLPPPPTDDSWEYAVVIEYTVPDVEVDGSLVPNVPDATAACFGGFAPATGDADNLATCAATVNATYDTGSIQYTLENVPYGAHTVKLAPATVSAVEALGYELTSAADLPVVVDATGPNPVPTPFTFVADNVDVTVTLGAAAQFFDDVATSIVWGTGTPITGVHVAPTTGGNTVTFANVPPQLTPYSITAAAALHTDYTGTVPVVPTATGTAAVTLDPAMTAQYGRVTGTATQTGATGTTPLAAGGQVRLLLNGVAVASVSAPLTDGRYEFDVAPGGYTVEVTQTAFPTATENVTVTAGTVTTENMAITQLATYTVTFPNASTLTSPDVSLRTGTTVVDQCSLVSGTTYECVVPAGTYDLSVDGGNYPATTVTSVTLAVGQVATASFPLPRYLDVLVSSGGVALSNVTMKVFRSGAPTVQVGSNYTINASTRITLPSAVWSETDDLLLEFTASGFRTLRETQTFALQGDATPTLWTLADVSAGISGVAANDLKDDDAFLSVVAADDGTQVSGESITCQSNACQYHVDNLGTTSTGAARTWVVTYDRFGKGYATGDIVVTPTGTVTGPALVIAEQQIEVTFTVTDGTNPLADASVQLGSLPAQLTGTDGTVTFSIGERSLSSWDSAAERAYTVTKTGYTAQTGTAPEFTSREVSVPSIPMPVAPTTTTTTTTSTTTTTVAPTTTTTTVPPPTTTTTSTTVAATTTTTTTPAATTSSSTVP